MLKKILLICFFFSPYMTLATVNENNLPPEQVVSEFYYKYLVAAEMTDMEASNISSLETILNYTTKHLRALRDKDDSGSDYFIDAQDICEEWKSSIVTNTISIGNNYALVNLSLGYGKAVSLYAISLVKVKDKWLINSVKPVSRGSVYCPGQVERGGRVNVR